MPGDKNDSVEAAAVVVAEPQEEQSSGTAHPIRYYAEIFPGHGVPLPDSFCAAVKEMEGILDIPIWLLIQNGEGACSSLDGRVFKGFRKLKAQISEERPVGLLVDSSGGDAKFAYHIARLFQRRTSQLTVMVPQYAKSAATLLALGASKLILGRDSELGPLDVQIFDPEREDYDSALNAVQSLERLNAFSLTAVDQAVRLFMARTGKKSDTLLPLVLEYVTNFVKPLLEKIDTVDYTKKSRDLKVAEQYAIRLMRPNFSRSNAERIAGHLVEKYSTHGFVIDPQEAEACEQVGPTEWFGLGLTTIETPAEGIEEAMEKIAPFLDTITAIGRLREVHNHEKEEKSA